MNFRIIFVLIFSVLVIIFALQNTEIVHVKLWFWEFDIPRALLIAISIIVGIMIGMFIPKWRKDKPNFSDEEL